MRVAHMLLAASVLPHNASVQGGVTVTVTDGAVGGRWVGRHTSQLQHAVGDYLTDRPLNLPSLFVLRLKGTLSAAANLSDVTPVHLSAMVQLNGTHY
eukprot:gene2230-15261_t